MKDFLNRYMASNRHLQRQDQDELRNVFTATTDLIYRAIGPKAFRPKRAVNAAVVDSLMTGIARRLAKGPISEETELKRRYDDLMTDEHYRSAVETGTAQEANVGNRLSLAEAAFAQVK